MRKKIPKHGRRSRKPNDQFTGKKITNHTCHINEATSRQSNIVKFKLGNSLCWSVCKVCIIEEANCKFCNNEYKLTLVRYFPECHVMQPFRTPIMRHKELCHISFSPPYEKI